MQLATVDVVMLVLRTLYLDAKQASFDAQGIEWLAAVVGLPSQGRRQKQ